MGAHAKKAGVARVAWAYYMAKPLHRFLQVLICLWLFSFLAGWVEGSVFHLSAASWYPLFLRNARFTDLTIYQERFSHFHQLEFFTMPGFPFTYPAPVALAYEGLFVLGPYALDAYLCLCFGVFVGAGICLGRALHRRGMGVVQAAALLGLTLLLSYPFWFMVDRANIEIVNWLLLAFGVAAYWNKKWYLAAAFFGIAISFKIFPFVFLGLLLSARKYWAIVCGLLVCVLTTVLSTWLVGPTYRLASEGIGHGLQFFRMQYALQVHPQEIGFDHSVFAIIKELRFKHSPGPLYYLPWLNGYMAVAAAAGILVYFWKIRALPRANQILALTVVSVLLPPVSGDYTLLHLYIPWGVLVLVAVSLKDLQEAQGLIVSLCCMAFLMAPESYVVVHGIKLGGQLKAIALLALFVVSIAFPIEEPPLVAGETAELPGMRGDASWA